MFTQINLEDEELKSPDFLENLFGTFGFCHFVRSDHCMHFARSEHSSAKSIVCYYNRGKNIRSFVKDFPRGIEGDLYKFLMDERGVTFLEVKNAMRNLLGNDYVGHKYRRKHLPFAGFFNRNRTGGNREMLEIKDEKILDEYEPIGNLTFLKDGISLKTQRIFEIGYDPHRSMITIPIRSHKGELIGVKARCQGAEEQIYGKYMFPHRCKAALTLYGYIQNYPHLFNADEIVIVEAEKSVMQAYTFKYHQCLAIGGSNISRRQCELLMYLNPKRVIFMMDEGLPENVILKNCKMLANVSHLRSVPIYYWKPTKDTPKKTSPTDLGREFFENAKENQLAEFKKEE